MRPHAVILFAGDARREEAEKGLPPRFLARLHAEHARTIAAMPDVDLFVAYEAAGAFREGGPALLGRRIEEAIRRAFAAGYRRVAIVAGDAARLDRATIDRAFASHVSVAVGRSPDGGFYLAAFAAPPSIDWTSLPWCTSTTCDALLAALSGQTVELLAEVEDIDDVMHVRDPHLRSWLHCNRLSVPGSVTPVRRPFTPDVTRGPPPLP
jgi:hypothetical protein